MNSFVEDRRPFAAAMQNYHLMDVDASTSQTSLNIPEDNGRKYRAERQGFLGVNLRLLFTVISIIFFILALILFIGTIVAYYSRPRSSEAHAPLHGRYENDETPDPTFNKDGSTLPGKQGEEGKTDISQNGSETKWSVTTLNGEQVKPGVLIYGEEFNSFNLSQWGHYTGDSDSNFFFHVDNRSNSYVNDGKLYLKPTYTEDKFGQAYLYNGTLLLGTIPSKKCLNDSILCWKGKHAMVHPIMSPMISSKNFLKFTYGKLQIRAKMPAGDWIEPIISLQPDLPTYGDDLRSGQIHFVDTRGNRKLYNLDNVNIGSEQTCPDIRYGTKENKRITYYCLNTEEDQGFDRDFHIYELEWTPRVLTIKIDGKGVVAAPFPRPSMYELWSKGRNTRNPWTEHSVNHVMAPFDKDFFLAFGVSVGGVNGFFADDSDNHGYQKPWNNTDPNAAKTFWEARNLWEPTWENDNSALQIDFIRLYSLNETISD